MGTFACVFVNFGTSIYVSPYNFFVDKHKTENNLIINGIETPLNLKINILSSTINFRWFFVLDLMF